jgi:hypothetical protein
MNPLTQKFAGTVIRSVLLIVAAKYGNWSEGEIDSFVNALLAFAVVAWGMYEKYQSTRTQNTTLAVMNRLTGPEVPNVVAQDIADVIKKGDAAPAMTPKDEAPKLTGTGDGMRLIRNVTGTGSGA